MKRFTLFLAGLLLASMVFTACSSPARTFALPTQGPAIQAPASGVPEICKTDAVGCAVFTPGQTIKIGMGAPMTGDNAAFGLDTSHAAKLAVSDAGLFKGYTFELVLADDGGTPDGGAAVAVKFVADPQVVAIAGHIFSEPTAAAIPFYEAAGLPMMSPSATVVSLTQRVSKVFNRCVFTDGKQGKFAASYLYNTLKVKNLAIIQDGSPYGQGITQVVNDQFKSLGGKVISFQAIRAGESDYSPTLADVASRRPDAIYFGGYSAEAVVLVNQMKQAGLTGITFFSDDGIYGQDFLDRTGANNEGVYATSAPPPPASAAKTRFDAAYLAAYGQPAGKLSTYTWNAYDSAAVLIKSVEKVAVLSGGNLYIPRATLVATVRTTKDFQGLSGTITCNPTGDCSTSDPVLNLVRSDKWEVVP